ncbi:MAG TPA: cytochrome c oxidase assembly protein [Solirubrobacteraceae bacterium]|jgi:cytochrome c oxidase assembly factor CtaG|nr:cytochrome c oxidase assembly protein [Solirubrobacteraceae bacterium]
MTSTLVAARLRRACLLCAPAAIAVALLTLGGSARGTLWASAAVQLAIGDIAALLVALGLSGALPTGLRRAVRVPAPLRRLGDPPAALALWALDLCVWHLEVFSSAAQRHVGVQALEYLCLLAFAVNMWTCLLGARQPPAWFGHRARLAYILAGRLALAGFGNLLLWSSGVLYAGYSATASHRHLSPLGDQALAGAIVVAESAAVALCLLGWLYARVRRETHERRRLLDFAHARGLRLAPERVERAAADGSALELCRRLEALLESPARAQPPATAGRIVSSAPSATGVARPSRKRMSSPAR